MPTSFDVRSSTGSYNVSITAGLFDAVLQAPGERVYIVDERVADRLPPQVEPITIIADEYAKSLDRMTDLIIALREQRVTRQTTLVAVGGGVVQDIVAFVASIFMRGVPWIYVPTTLLSMTDSCIGGKSSINVGRYKNIVGTFHPPAQIAIDPGFVRTLSAEQRAAGLCEAAKISFCRGAEAFDAYLALAPSVAGGDEEVAQVVALSLRSKTWFVEIDEFDRAERLLLNFGHTFGHAIEAASQFRISHGIAVGLGILAALKLGEALGRDYSGNERVTRLRAHVQELLRSVDGLADEAGAVDLAAIMDAFQSDKKHAADRYAVIVVAQGGEVERLMLPRDARSSALVEGAFAATLLRQDHAVAA